MSVKSQVIFEGGMVGEFYIGDPSCDDNTDRWEVYLRRKIGIFPKTSVYHTLFIWEEKTDAECIVLNT